jgi:transcriptional regulator with XRE-family HTH domain
MLANFYYSERCMRELGERLREMRSARRGSLEAVSRAAKISPAYLHKLEAGLVKAPSPHVIRRLAEALEVPYPTLMELAGYIDRGESTMASSGAPTNAEIVRLLEELTREVAALKQTQDELLRKVGGR